MFSVPTFRVALDQLKTVVKAGLAAPSDPLYLTLTYLGIAALLVCMAGMMSGLTLGLMSLSKVDVQLLIETGTPKEKLYAARIMPLISNPHFLLCTLLVGNALAMEGLPLVLQKVVDPITAIVLSVTVVLIAGEIVPQAICTRYGLAVGGISAPFVKVIRALFSPVSWPIGKLLDILVGHDDSALFRRPQLKAFVDMHASHSGLGGTLQRDEVLVIQGALDLVHKTAIESMTPLEKVFMLCTEDVLNEDTLRRVMASGHSRIPVYQHPNRLHIVGLIITKELARLSPADCVPVKDCRMRSLPHLPSDMPLFDLLDLFQIGRSHMALLCTPDIPTDTPFQDEATYNPTPTPSLPPSPSPPALSGSVEITIPEPGAGQGRLRPRSAEGTGGSPARGTTPNGRGPTTSAAGEGAVPRSPGSDGYVMTHAEEQAANNQEDFWELQGEPVGIITLEDVIEELLHTEIIDETDRFVDNEQTQRVNVGLLVKKLPARLRHHLSAETLLPVLEQTKAAISQARNHQAPTPAPAGASPPTEPPATAVVRRKSWTSPYHNLQQRSPLPNRQATSSSSSPNIQQHQRLRATMSEGDETHSLPSSPLSTSNSLDQLPDRSSSSQPPQQQPFIRRKVSFKLPVDGIVAEAEVQPVEAQPGQEDSAPGPGLDGIAAPPPVLPVESAMPSPFAAVSEVQSVAISAAFGEAHGAAVEGQDAQAASQAARPRDDEQP